ncbi:MAG: hypothetical protein ABWZ25_04995 [Chitinophagaceae bacterium]
MRSSALVAIAAVCLLLVSCDDQLAVKYNNHIVSQLDSRFDAGSAFVTHEIERFIEGGQWDSMAYASKKMVQLVDERIKDVSENKPPAVNGAREFQKESLIYLNFIRNIYIGYRKVAEQPDDEARAVEFEQFSKMLEGSNAAETAIHNAQIRFARDNNLKVGY